MLKKFKDIPVGGVFHYAHCLFMKTKQIGDHEWDSITLVNNDEDQPSPGWPSRWNDELKVNYIPEITYKIHEFKVGDLVEVLDPGLEKLQQLIKESNPELAKPLNRGVVHEILDDGCLLIAFPIGDDDMEKHSQVAPYPPHMVKKRSAVKLSG